MKVLVNSYTIDLDRTGMRVEGLVQLGGERGIYVFATYMINNNI